MSTFQHITATPSWIRTHLVAASAAIVVAAAIAVAILIASNGAPTVPARVNSQATFPSQNVPTSVLARQKPPVTFQSQNVPTSVLARKSAEPRLGQRAGSQVRRGATGRVIASTR